MKNPDNRDFFIIVRQFFVEYLPNECGYGPNTIKAYKDALNLFFSYVCNIKGIRLPKFHPSYITRENVNNFLNYIEKERGCSVSTRNHRLSALRSFLKYAAEQGAEYVAYYLEISLIPTKKREKTNDISFFSEEALSAILAVPNPNKETEARDLLFMVLLYDTGARVQELLDVRLGDFCFNRKDRYVVLTGKGGKTRDVPLMEKTKEHFGQYIKKFEPERHDGDLLFYVVRHGECGKMSQDNVAKFIQRYSSLAREKCIDVPAKVHPHMFRHSRAMHLYRSGMPLELVSEWLGHAQLETTIRFYANADLAMKQTAIEKATSQFNPLVRETIQFSYDDEDDAFRRMYGLI